MVGAVGLFMWTVMERVIYERGAVESEGTLVITYLFIGHLTLAYLSLRHWLYPVLMMLAGATIIWTWIGVDDAYTFKAGKNLLFDTGLLCVWIARWSGSRSSSSGWQDTAT